MTIEPGFRTVSSFCVEAVLDLQVLDDRLDDPVAVGEQAEIVFQIARRDQLGVAWAHERSGIGFQQALDRALGDGAAVVWVLADDV